MQMKTNWVHIGTAATLLGLNKDTLRIWELKGMIKPRRNPRNNYREYSVTKLLKIKMRLKNK